MAYATVTLTGTYQTPDGTPHKGHVEVIPSERVIKDTTGDVILTGRVKVDLDAQGAFTVALPATDDPTLNPTGFGYTIAAKLHSSHPPAVSFSLPASLGATTVEDLTPVDPSTFAPTTTYAESSEVAALDSRVTTVESDIAGKADAADVPTTPADLGAEPAGLAQATQDTLANTYADRKVSLLGDMPRAAEVDKVMSNPPTVGALTTTTAIANSTEWPSVDFSGGNITVGKGLYTYRAGGKIQVFGTAYPNYLYVNAKSITDPVNANNAPFAVDFLCDAPQMELMFKGTGTAFRIRVDGELVTAGPTVATTTNGQTYFLPLTFPSRRLRKISVEGDVSFTWGGVRTGPTDTVLPAQQSGLRCIVVGDSFTDGAGADAKAATVWVRRFGESMGWADTWASGLGGTGYVNPGTGGRVKFRDRLQADVFDNEPDVVVFAGGINDYAHANAANLPTEVAGCLADTRAALPHALIVVLSPFWRNGPSTFPTNLLTARDQIKTAAEAAGAIYLDVLEMPLNGTPTTTTVSADAAAGATTLSLGTVIPVRSTIEIGTGATKERRTVTAVAGAGPFLHTVKALSNAHVTGEPVTEVGSPLWSGTGKVGATTGDGNSDLLVSNDGTHPSQAGHDALGTLVARLLASELMPHALTA